MHRYFLFSLIVFSSAVMAADDVVPEVPDMPMAVQDGEPMESDITITRKGNKTIHEYRVNGKIYKIKIIPDVGPAYYFIDPDGDGEMEEVSESDLEKGLNINQWTIFSW